MQLCLFAYGITLFQVCKTASQRATHNYHCHKERVKCAYCDFTDFKSKLQRHVMIKHRTPATTIMSNGAVMSNLQPTNTNDPSSSNAANNCGQTSIGSNNLPGGDRRTWFFSWIFNISTAVAGYSKLARYVVAVLHFSLHLYSSAHSFLS